MKLCLARIPSVLILLIASTLISTNQVEGQQWQHKADMPTPRFSFATSVVDGKIYVIGGQFRLNLSPLGTSIVEIYHPATDTWTRGANMPTPRLDLSTSVVNGKIYAIGGYNGVDNQTVNINWLPTVEIYHPATDTWTKGADMPTPRSSVVSSVVDGKIYVMGGTLKPQEGKPWRTDAVEVYNPEADTWSTARKMPTIRAGGFGAAIDGKMYVMGGSGWPAPKNQPGPFLVTVEEYDPSRDRWRPKADMPVARTSAASCVVNNLIYLIGGKVRENAFAPLAKAMDIYDPVREIWEKGDELPTDRFSHSAEVINGIIYLVGGWEEGGILTPLVEAYDTGVRSITPIGKLTTSWGQVKLNGR